MLDEPKQPNSDLTQNVWVYVATIGELNLAEILIRNLIAAIPHGRLVLLTDRSLYVDTYRRKFPDAVIAMTDGRTSQARELLRCYPPKALILAEIPCWPADAPCRLHYSLPALVSASGAPVVLVNAWIYDYPPASRAERLERILFRREYLRTMRLITTQTDEVRNRLISEGADPVRVHVTGNMKFDGLARVPDRTQESPLLHGLTSANRPCVVAGSIGQVEQAPLIAAFRKVRERHSLRIVIALRHPENVEHLRSLIELLEDAGLTWTQRTRQGDNALAEDCDCLVLDTFGELARFYSVGTIAYVARDHNVLEPLAYGVPVTVLAGWKSVYPSYPVYRLLREQNLLSEANGADDLADLWLRFLDQKISNQATLDHRERSTLDTLRGATERNIQLILNELKTAGIDTIAAHREGVPAEVQAGARAV